MQTKTLTQAIFFVMDTTVSRAMRLNMFVYVVCVTHPELLLLAPDLVLTHLSCLRSLTQNIHQSCPGLFFFFVFF